MAKRTHPPAKPAPVSRTSPQRLTRRQIAHEFGRLSETRSIAELSRQTKIPYSTLRGWIKRGEVSKKGLERSRRALPIARRVRRPPARRKAPPALRRNRADAASAVHLAFATGIVPIADGMRIKPPSFAPVAAAIAAATRLPRSPSVTADRLETIRENAFDEHDNRDGAAEENGFEYRRKFAGSGAGQTALSEAWIRELRWVMRRGELLPNFIAPFDSDLVAEYNHRQNGHFYTDNATAMWQLFEYCRLLPAGYFGITYDPPEGEVYEVKTWVKDSHKKKRRKKK